MHEEIIRGVKAWAGKLVREHSKAMVLATCELYLELAIFDWLYAVGVGIHRLG